MFYQPVCNCFNLRFHVHRFFDSQQFTFCLEVGNPTRERFTEAMIPASSASSILVLSRLIQVPPPLRGGMAVVMSLLSAPARVEFCCSASARAGLSHDNRKPILKWGFLFTVVSASRRWLLTILIWICPKCCCPRL